MLAFLPPQRRANDHSLRGRRRSPRKLQRPVEERSCTDEAVVSLRRSAHPAPRSSAANVSRLAASTPKSIFDAAPSEGSLIEPPEIIERLRIESSAEGDLLGADLRLADRHPPTAAGPACIRLGSDRSAIRCSDAQRPARSDEEDHVVKGRRPDENVAQGKVPLWRFVAKHRGKAVATSSAESSRLFVRLFMRRSRRPRLCAACTRSVHCKACAVSRAACRARARRHGECARCLGEIASRKLAPVLVEELLGVS